MTGALIIDLKVKVNLAGKEFAARPYFFPTMDFNGNIDGFDVSLVKHRLPAMNPSQKAYYRKQCIEVAKKLSVLFPDNGDYFCRPVRSLPTLEELHDALCKIGG